jgi:DNA-binding NtrC family response regulator
MKSILIITDIESTTNFFNLSFKEEFNISTSQSIESAVENYTRELFDYLFIDLINLKGFTNQALTEEGFLAKFQQLEIHYPTSRKIVMAERRLTHECILTLKWGIDNYLNYPLIKEEIRHLIDLEYEILKKEAVTEHFEAKDFKAIHKCLPETKTTAMNEIFEQVKLVAGTKSTILITGESGTGKSVLAKMIHDLSSRRDNKFIAVHCGAIAEGLIESELFGHEKGSFTGAIKRKLGKFELANGGTIFLDEIGTISKATQINLLQVLQERFIQRVGGEEDIPVDVRIIAATNNDLQQSIIDGLFREDLYFRLNVFPIEIPPLRDRKEDISNLSSEILKKLNSLYGKGIQAIDPELEFAFYNYPWPGNIRELENIIERAYVLEKNQVLTLSNIPKAILQKKDLSKEMISSFPSLNLHEARRHTLDIFEKKYLEELLKSAKGNLKSASHLSGVSIRQLHKFISKHNINRKTFCLSFDPEDIEQKSLQL